MNDLAWWYRRLLTRREIVDFVGHGHVGERGNTGGQNLTVRLEEASGHFAELHGTAIGSHLYAFRTEHLGGCGGGEVNELHVRCVFLG